MKSKIVYFAIGIIGFSMSLNAFATTKYFKYNVKNKDTQTQIKARHASDSYHALTTRFVTIPKGISSTDIKAKYEAKLVGYRTIHPWIEVYDMNNKKVCQINYEARLGELNTKVHVKVTNITGDCKVTSPDKSEFSSSTSHIVYEPKSAA